MSISSATEARLKMIARMKQSRFDEDQDKSKQTRNDSDDAPASNADEARRKMLARMRGEKYIPKKQVVYHEDKLDRIINSVIDRFAKKNASGATA